MEWVVWWCGEKGEDAEEVYALALSSPRSKGQTETSKCGGMGKWKWELQTRC